MIFSNPHELIQEAKEQSLASPRQGAAVFIREIENRFQVGDLDFINQLLGALDFTGMNVRSMLGTVRSTARARAGLSNWEDAYIRSRKEMRDTGYDPNIMYLGMDPPANEL